MKHHARTFITLVLAVSVAFANSACSTANKNKQPVSGTEFLLDTTCTISLYDRPDNGILKQAFALCRHYDDLFSITKKGSDIYKINNASGTPVRVDPDTVAVIDEGIKYGKESGGLFDITVGALSTLWNFTAEHPKVPTQVQIDSALSTISYKDIAVTGDTVVLKKPGAMIDLGGIAKGFIADKIKNFLISKGVGKAIINLGGNVVVIGSKAAGNPWIVGVQQPFMQQDQDIGYLYVADKSVVTSGIYERYFIENDKLYAHILDPRTGFPVINDLSSVTIVSDKSADGDGLSTTCFILGVDEAEKLIESLGGIEAIFVTKDGRVITTPGINKNIKFVPELPAAGK